VSVVGNGSGAQLSGVVQALIKLTDKSAGNDSILDWLEKNGPNRKDILKLFQRSGKNAGNIVAALGELVDRGNKIDFAGVCEYLAGKGLLAAPLQKLPADDPTQGIFRLPEPIAQRLIHSDAGASFKNDRFFEKWRSQNPYREAHEILQDVRMACLSIPVGVSSGEPNPNAVSVDPERNIWRYALQWADGEPVVFVYLRFDKDTFDRVVDVRLAGGETEPSLLANMRKTMDDEQQLAEWGFTNDRCLTIYGKDSEQPVGFKLATVYKLFGDHTAPHSPLRQCFDAVNLSSILRRGGSIWQNVSRYWIRWPSI
jgi:hypothetical protein